MSKKWLRPLFRVFARACVHAFGAHLSLEKCKKPRTGRGFLRIDEEQRKKPSYTTRFFDSLKPPQRAAFLLCRDQAMA